MTTFPYPAVAYFDHAATTPMTSVAAATMAEHLTRVGNPSSLHASGRAARRTVEESREAIAERLGARPGDVVFTSGGTEADNIAVKGLYWARNSQDARRTRILAPATEHHAVLDPLEWLATAEGAEVELVGVDDHGRVRLTELRERILRDPATVALVTCMWANNEVGTVAPLRDVVALAHAHDIPVHSDAVQALGHVPVDFTASGLDAMTVTAHKIGGPVGVGALLVRRELDVVPLLHGGGQERDIRSGTMNAPAVAAFAAAVDLAVVRQPVQAARLEALRSDLIERVHDVIPTVVVNGDPAPGPAHRLPSIAHLTFPGCEGDSLLMLLDAHGVECSTGSACTAGVPQASHVLLAMGQDEIGARSSLRLSLGHTSSSSDVDALLRVLPAAYERARAAGLTGARSR